MAQSLDKDKDLTRYEQLVKLQDSQVRDAAVQLESGQHYPRADGQAGLDRPFVDTAVHEAFGAMEAQDQTLEARIRDSPDLQMVQVGERHRGAGRPGAGPRRAAASPRGARRQSGGSRSGAQPTARR